MITLHSSVLLIGHQYKQHVNKKNISKQREFDKKKVVIDSQKGICKKHNQRFIKKYIKRINKHKLYG